MRLPQNDTVRWIGSVLFFRIRYYAETQREKKREVLDLPFPLTASLRETVFSGGDRSIYSVAGAMGAVGVRTQPEEVGS